MNYSIDQTRCTGCGRCLEACSASAIFLVDGKAQIDENLCRDCGACFQVCPQGAIQEETALAKPNQAIAERPKAISKSSGFKKAAISIGSSLATFAISKLVSSLTDSTPGKSGNTGTGGLGRGNGRQCRKRRGRNR